MLKLGLPKDYLKSRGLAEDIAVWENTVAQVVKPSRDAAQALRLLEILDPPDGISGIIIRARALLQHSLERLADRQPPAATVLETPQQRAARIQARDRSSAGQPAPQPPGAGGTTTDR